MFFILQSHGKLPLCDNTSKYINQANSNYPNGHGTEKLTDEIKMFKLRGLLNHLKTHRRSKEKKKGEINTEQGMSRVEGPHCLIPDPFSQTRKSSPLMVWF